MESCSHLSMCPGCPRWGQRGIGARAGEALEELAQEAGLPLPLELREGPPLGFRHRARLAVRGRWRAAKIGIFAKGTHQIVDIPSCPIHHPLINEACEVLKAGLWQHRISPYHEASGRGALRYVQVVVERSSQSLQLVLVDNHETPEVLEPLFAYLQQRLPLHSLWWNGNPGSTNTILGPHWKAICGPEAVCEEMGGARIFFPPGAFGQSHLPLAEEMVSTVHSWIPPAADVAEFYAGCGAFGLGLARRGHRVAFNEIGAHSLRGLQLGLAALPEAAQQACSILPGPAQDATLLLEPRPVAIVDPPRKGIDEPLLQALIDAPPSRLISVSCGLDAFLQQTRRLIHDSPLQLKQILLFGLFPYTEHVEILSLFEHQV